MKRKFLSVVLALCMVLGMLPATALATEGDTQAETGAVTALPEAVNGVITLTENVTLDSPYVVENDTTLTIDLAGFELTYNSTVQGEAMITNKGTLTINDSSDPDTGVINYNYTGAADSSYGKGNYTISNAGTLTVNGGKITIANLRAHAKYPINNNSTSGDAVLIINGGHLYNYNTSAIRQFCNSTTYKNSVTIAGGLIEGYCAIWMQNPGANTVNGKLTITGGELKSTAAAYVNGTSELKDVGSRLYCTIDGEGGAWSEGSSVSITGGIFNENVELAEAAPASITIGEGATFNGRLELPADPVAQIGETTYATLADAIETAQDDDTVTLLKDVTLSEILVINKAITLDGNGKTLTYTGVNRAIEVSKDDNAIINLTIRNLTVDCTADYCQRGINYNENGTLTLDGVIVKGKNLSYALNLPADSDGAKVVLTDSSLTGSIALNLWGEGTTVSATDTAFTSVDESTEEDYAAIALNNDGTNTANGSTVTVTGGSITACKEDKETPSIAVRDSTASTVNISNTTEVTGAIEAIVAIITYAGSGDFYSFITLQEAIEFASAGDTITLIRDIALSESVTIPENVTLALNGKTITAAEGYKLIVDGKNYNVVELYDITFDSNGGSAIDAITGVVGGESITLPDAPTHGDPYYVFNGWKLDSATYSAGDVYIVTNNTTFIAQWYDTYIYIPPYIPEPEVETPSVDTDSPVTESTTTENADGTTTTTETLENGATVETTTNTDGSTTSVATKTETVETGESTTTTTTTVTTNTSASGETVTESVQEVKEEKSDGSSTTTTTTVTESEAKTEKVEIKQETVVAEDGTETTTTTSTTETELSNGSTGTTTVDETGAVTAEVAVSNAAVTEAAAADTAVALPMPAVEAAASTETAAAVTVDLPAGTNSATVAIPVAEGTGAGTVAVIVNADGTETIVTQSKVTENGLEVEVSDGATVKVVDNSTDFADVNDNDWEKDAVDFTSARGIMNGTSTGTDATFDSDAVTTRALIWTMLARLSGVDTTPAEGEDWWTVGQKWAMENGVSDGTMHDSAVTREQLATMLHRFVGEPETDHDITHYDDHHETSDWALEAKQWAVENGVINGVGQADGSVTLDPQGNAIRSHVAQMFMNFMTKVSI